MKTFDKKDFEKAIELYLEWNSKINVVSRKDVDNIWDHHFLHSLALTHYLSDVLGEKEQGLSFLDVGTGGGFPGIPMAMSLPDCSFTLVDSIGKKILVASSVAASLGLANVKCVNARAESLEGQFDYVVSRAVTSLENFYPWVKGRYRKSILYLKGGDVVKEAEDMCRRFGVPVSKVSVWPVSDWIDDEYYKEKYIVRIDR